MQEHDELCIHGDTDVIGELGDHTALHFGLTASICNTAQSQRGFILYKLHKCLLGINNSNVAARGYQILKIWQVIRLYHWEKVPLGLVHEWIWTRVAFWEGRRWSRFRGCSWRSPWSRSEGWSSLLLLHFLSCLHPRYATSSALKQKRGLFFKENKNIPFQEQEIW